MSDEQGIGGSYEHVTIYSYNVHNEQVADSSSKGPGAAWEHDLRKRVFRIVEPDVKPLEFHDRPMRYLIVEQDPETGHVQPATFAGRVRIVYLCREVGR